MNQTNRRGFLKLAGCAAAAVCLPRFAFAAEAKPNIILAMADDLGWGDTGYNGHPVLKTPALDEMAAAGLRFNRFYAGAPVCSPTRGSCLTGRHPFRYGIFFANVGHMRKQEVTLAEALKTQGYATGHFGKWHLGTLSKTDRSRNRGAGKALAEHYSPPQDNGFDVCFCTESKVPTYDPMKDPKTGKPYGSPYYDETGRQVTGDLSGDDSKLIMDRAIAFIRSAATPGTPFLAVIWFHAPHLPVIAGPKHRKPYEGRPGSEPDYYGCITAMDEQLGRLRHELRSIGIAKNTLLWFCSDNGPEGGSESPKSPGTTNGLRGRKRSLFEGGLRVPGLLEWPARIPKPHVTDVPCCTSDYFATTLDVLGFKFRGRPEPEDGISLLPLIDGKMPQRPVPIAFQTRGNRRGTRGSPRIALIDNRYKLLTDLGDTQDMLFDLIKDPGEKKNIAAENSRQARKMRATLSAWQNSCKQSLAGDDYRAG